MPWAMLLKFVKVDLTAVMKSWWFPYLLLAVGLWYVHGMGEDSGYSACELDYAEAKEEAVAEALKEADELQRLIDIAAADVSSNIGVMVDDQMGIASEVHNATTAVDFNPDRIISLLNQSTDRANQAAE